MSVIKVHGTADGMLFQGELWIESFDVDGVAVLPFSRVNADGSVTINCAFGGVIELTRDRSRAMHFDGTAEAMRAWNTVSATRPRRPDGLPNKPLTALTVEVGP